MSKKFLVPIDMNGLEIQNFLAHNLAAAPAAANGKIYFNTQDKKLYYHNGTSWVALTANTNVAKTTTTPKMNGTAAIGSETKYAAGDHVHPSDTSRVPTTRKVNGKALSADITLDAEDISSGAGEGNSVDDVLTELLTNKVDKVSGKGLSTNDYTTAEKNKLAGIATGAEVNQSAFSVIIAGGTQLIADSDEDMLEIRAGSNVSITAPSNKAIQIAATDTTYSPGTAALIEEGANTSNRVWSSKILHDYIASAIGGVDAMRFKGTIGTGGTVTTLPTSGVKVGDTYRVITAGTYASQKCEVGDLIIATATTPTWTVAQTNIDGAITSLSNGTGISVTGSGSSRTIGLASGVATAGSKGDTSNQTPTWGGTFKVTSETIDTYGRTTALAEHTVKIPDAVASIRADGLMSSADRAYIDRFITKVNSINTAVIQAGQTSVQVGAALTYFQAIDYVSGEEVMVDVSYNGNENTATFSIAAPYTNDISINYISGAYTPNS